MDGSPAGQFDREARDPPLFQHLIPLPLDVRRASLDHRLHVQPACCSERQATLARPPHKQVRARTQPRRDDPVVTRRHERVLPLIDPATAMKSRERAVERLAGPHRSNATAAEAEPWSGKCRIAGMKVPEHPVTGELSRQIERMKTAAYGDVDAGSARIPAIVCALILRYPHLLGSEPQAQRSRGQARNVRPADA